MTSLELVKVFHETYDQPILDEPKLDDDKVNELRLSLIEEELFELRVALDNRDAVEALDALTDLQYVLDGTYLSLGLWRWKDAALEEVQRSNLSKLWPGGQVRKYPNGKVMKGPSFSEPDLAMVLRKEVLAPDKLPWYRRLWRRIFG